jgi:hypothetical protein
MRRDGEIDLDGLTVREQIDKTMAGVTAWPWQNERDQGEEGPSYPYQLTAPEVRVPRSRGSDDTRAVELAGYEDASEVDALLMERAPEWVDHLRGEVDRLTDLLAGNAAVTEAELRRLRSENARLAAENAEAKEAEWFRDEERRMEYEMAAACEPCPECKPPCKRCHGAGRVPRRGV